MMSEVQPLSLAVANEYEPFDSNSNPDQPSTLPSLDRSIIDIIKSIPDHTIRPARVAAELGISVNEACAELCGLLAAVGGGAQGASFRFEKIEGLDVMVFQFPPDFEARALRKQKLEDMWTSLRKMCFIGIRALKILTAFGLVLSLLILCIAAVAGLFAALLAISRVENRGGTQRSVLMRQIRTLFYTMRQLLWFYAVFGPTTSEGQDPVLREIAFDLHLILSCCCGNPGSIFYWIRAQQLSRRRNNVIRRWSRPGWIQSDVEGVFLRRADGTWSSEDDTRLSTSSSAPPQEAYRGILSLAVEFLFGPEPASPDDPARVWKLRASVIMNRSSNNAEGGIPLLALAPYLDNPPASLDTTGRGAIVEQGLIIVTYFNGVPKKSNKSSGDMMEAEFIFPELMAESVVSTVYDHTVSNDRGTWEDFLYSDNGGDTRTKVTDLPQILNEERYKFTKMTSKQLSHCVALGVLNLIGVLMFGQSVGRGGILELNDNNPFSMFILGLLLPVLKGYAMLFLLIPAARLLLLVFLNKQRAERNERRRRLAQAGQAN